MLIGHDHVSLLSLGSNLPDFNEARPRSGACIKGFVVLKERLNHCVGVH
jgi:hypothetical protein